MSRTTELNSVKRLVLRVLEHYPETRNSDNKLYIQCAKELGAKTVDDIMGIKLNLITLHKCRQRIQNKDGMFLPNKEVAEARYERQLEFRDWYID